MGTGPPVTRARRHGAKFAAVQRAMIARKTRCQACNGKGWLVNARGLRVRCVVCRPCLECGTPEPACLRYAVECCAACRDGVRRGINAHPARA